MTNHYILSIIILNTYKGVCSGMIRELIYKYLRRKRDKEQHEVIKLRWKKAELERLLEQRKKESQYGEIR